MGVTAEFPQSWIVELPKAEIHLHLEGSVPESLVAGAARRHGITPPDTKRLHHDDAAEPAAAAGIGMGAAIDGSPPPATGNLRALLANLDASCSLLDRADDLLAVAYDVATRTTSSGTRHVDVIVNPTHWPAWRYKLGALVDALDAGFSAGEQDGGTTAVLCISLARTQTHTEALELVELTVGLGHPRVGALSIDGDESGGSHNARFVDAFATGGAAGLRRCAHAGESSGANGVREAIDLLGAERIDHGIRSVEDPSLVAELARRGVSLDICPTSTVILGYVPDIRSPPIDSLRRAGVPVSLNTDDPLLYGVDLAGEFERCTAAFGWNERVLAGLARTSIVASFANEDRQRVLLGQLDRFVTTSS
jgi:adenosine deaminase